MSTIHDMTAAGLTERQARYWSATGLLRADDAAPGTGRSMTWPRAEVDVARIMARLVAAGLTPSAAARAARGEELAPGVRVEIDAYMSVAA